MKTKKKIRYAVYREAIFVEYAYFTVYLPNTNLYNELNERIKERYPAHINVNHTGKVINA